MQITPETITIPLQLSSNATSDFQIDNLIQFEAYNKIENLLQKNLIKIDKQNNIQEDTTRYHEAITVLGNRGSGKTSFLLNLESYVQNPKDIEFLEILDPTLFESKQHVLLTVISRIITTIETNEHLNLDYKQKFEESLEILADGINLLDGIDDSISHKSIWDDARINFNKGIQCSKKGLNFEKDFRRFIYYSLKYLNKKLFVLMFDDIDTNVEKGWPVLEVIRKYLTMLNIQVIVSGDWALFSKLVRIHQLSNLKGLKDIEEKCADCSNRYDYLETLDTLEEQYLTKILKPENRIILRGLNELIQTKTFYLHIDENSENIELEQAYRELFNFSLLLNNNASFDNFKSLFLNLPLRSNIQLLNSFYQRNSYDEFIDNLGKQFLTQLARYNFSMNDLYNVKSDTLIYNLLKKALELANNSELNFNDFLRLSSYVKSENQERNILLYVLKSHVTAAINRNKALTFDWLFKIELFKHFFETPIKSIEEDLKYLGFGVPTSGRQFVQRLNGYNPDNLIGFIGVYKDKSKKHDKSYQYLRDELLKTDSSALIIINLMFSQVTKKNSSQVDLYGSIYYLLGAIGEILTLPNTEEALRDYFSANARIATVLPYDQNSSTTIFMNEENISQNLISKKLISDFQNWLNKKDNLATFPLDVLEKTMSDFLLFQSNMPEVSNFADYITLQSIYFLRALLDADANQTLQNEIITFQRIRKIETAKQLFKSAVKKYDENVSNKNSDKLRIFTFIYACPIWDYILNDEELDNQTIEHDITDSSLGNLFSILEEEVLPQDINKEEIEQQPLIKLLEGLKLHGSDSNEILEEHDNIDLSETNQEVSKNKTYDKKDFTCESIIKIFSEQEENLQNIRISNSEELEKVFEKYRSYLIPKYFGKIRLNDDQREVLKQAILAFNNLQKNV